MIGKVKVVSCSMKVHPATCSMLECYPLRELQQYARSIGVAVGKTKVEMIDNLMRSNKATICGGLGN